MKKVLGRLAIGVLIELPLVVLGAHLSVRVKQLATKHTDEEILAMLAEKLPFLLPLIAAAIKVKNEEAENKAAEAQKAATASGDYRSRPQPPSSPW